VGLKLKRDICAVQSVQELNSEKQKPFALSAVGIWDLSSHVRNPVRHCKQTRD